MHANLSVQRLSYKGGGLAKKKGIILFFVCESVVVITGLGVDYYIYISLTVAFIKITW